ncbi:MAG: hypothetical protein AAGI30_07550 [Planctomycetota bacterium]
MRWTTPGPRQWMAIAAMILGVLTASPAHAQALEPFESRWVVVEQEDTLLRSGAAPAWYPVASLGAGTPLLAEGRVGEDWLHVAYPPGTPAVVVIREGALDEEANEVELVARSFLRAFNAERGGTPFRNLLPDRPLSIGDRLPFVEPLRDSIGATVGYIVEAPPEARGYVLAAQVRPATVPEAEAFDRARSAAMPEQNEPSTDNTDAQGGTADPDGQTDGDDQPETEPGQSAPAGDSDDAETPQPGPEPGLGPRTTDQSELIMQEDPLIAELDALDAAFERVQAQSVVEGEFTELAARYRALGERAAAESPETTRLPAYAETRAAVLDLRAEVQSQTRRAAELRAEAERWARGERATTSEPPSGYRLVGVLTASAIYTGAEAALPLLYRVQSSDARVRLTLAYVRPPEGETLDDLLGQTVGVRDGTVLMETGRVPIVEADAIEVLGGIE